MRIDERVQFPAANDGGFVRALVAHLQRIAAQLNLTSDGRISAALNVAAAVPTAGVYQVGDFVRNSAPVETGAAASKYVVIGWVCVTSPNTFVACRSLTGN